ncbi:MAG TPA: tetratricopeptide repeat protein [Tepidisphaeraceae bacterium]|jgi:protein O-GlcNAc transferase|nr:tetratricopeptide repeat protein [Tepidisphaeraceae bacterium]
MGLVKSFAALSLMAGVAGCQNQQQAAHPPQPPRDQFEAMSDPPIQAQTYLAAGQLAESQGRLPDAIAQYQKALSEKPDYLDPLYRLGIVYTQQKDFTNAIETWNKYVTATGGSPAAYSNLGFCQELAGNPPAAEAAYKAGIAKDPQSEPCHVNYGLMLARHNKPNQALLELQKVLTPAKAHYDLASVYESQHRPQDARAEYRKAIDLDPSLAEAKQKLAALESQ